MAALVHIRDLRVRGILGIKPEEQAVPQEILVNVDMVVDIAAAAESDDIADTANYRTVAKAIIAHVESGRPFLVERLVTEIADLVLASEPRVEEVEVTIEKPGALRHARSVGITLRRSRLT